MADCMIEWAEAIGRIKDLEIEVERLENLLHESNRQLALAYSEIEALKAVYMSEKQKDPFKAFAETVFSPLLKTEK